MKKTIKLCDKEYNIKSSAYTLFKYKNDTNRDLLKDIQSIGELQDVENQTEKMGKLADVLLRITYTLIEEADKTQVNSFEDFLKGLDGIFDDVEWINEVVQCAITPFSRGQIQTNETK